MVCTLRFGHTPRELAIIHARYCDHLLALCLVATPSWVNYFNVDADLPTTTYQWDFPQDTKSDEGLGGGLQWAAQGASGGGIEEFCELLLPASSRRRWAASSIATQFTRPSCSASRRGAPTTG